MLFYKITQKPETLAIRLSPKNPEKKFHAKWYVIDQKPDYVAISKMLPCDKIGLYLGEGTICLYGMHEISEGIPCVILLIEEQRWYIPKQCVTILSDKEIQQILNDKQKQSTA